MIGRILAAVFIVAVVLGVMYYFIIYKSTTTATPQELNANPSLGRPPYYSKATYDLINSGTLGGAILAKYGLKATNNITGWRLIADDEFGSIHGTWDWQFGYDTNHPPAGKPGFNSIAQWYKGMNLNPVSLQGYACLFINDITLFAQKTKQYNYPFTEIKIGEFVA